MWRILVGPAVLIAWCIQCVTNKEIAYWDTTLKYTWPAGTNETEYLADGRYVPENVKFSAVAVHNDVIFLAVSRLKPGVPWVLVKPDLTEWNSPQLVPWIPHDQQRPGNCRELQNPLALDFDHDNELLYVLDNGVTEILTDDPDKDCEPKIMVYDMNGNVVLSQELSSSAVSSKSVLLSFVLDKPDTNAPFAQHAFIADGTGDLIVHNLKKQKTWSFFDSSMKAKNQNVTINSGSVRVRYGINTLAMSSLFDYVYFTSSGRADFYQIPVAALIDHSSDISSHIRTLSTTMGNKWTVVNGLTSTKNTIYFSAQEQNNIRRWRFIEDTENQGLTYPDDLDFVIMNKTSNALGQSKFSWPYTMGVDDKGYMYFLSSDLELLYEGELDTWDHDPADAKEKILMREQIDEKSYHHEMDHADVVG